MPINEHPDTGTVLVCDYDQGFRAPEMVKRRLVLVLSPKISVRHGLCTVVAISSTPPTPEMPYHYKIDFDPPLPKIWGNKDRWVKGDMINAVGFHRLDLLRHGKDRNGKRIYHYDTISEQQLHHVRRSILSGLGLARLTKAL